MLSLQVVHGLLSVLGSLLVGVVESVPVYLAVLLACLPVVHGVVPAIPVVDVVSVLEVAPHVVVGRWHVLPVVWLRILGVVVVELGALVHGVFSEEGCGELHAVVDVPVPCGDGRRGEVVHYSRVTLVSVLVSPVWVVVVVVGKPVGLVGRSALGASLGRVAPGGETQGVAVHPLLLHAEEIGEGVVVGALHVSAVGPSVGESGSDGPSLGVESAGVGVESAQGVVAVGSSHAGILSFLHASGTEIIVVGTRHSGHGIAVGLERQREIHVA